MGCNGARSAGLSAAGGECQHHVFIENKQIRCIIFTKQETAEVCDMRGTETELMLKGYGLTTAELFYRMPDYKSVINSFVWQDYDLAPDYPKLFEFIEFWQDKIEGPLHSVRFTHRKLIGPGEWRNVVGELRLH
jgi:uncharacterized protein Usg